jgi:hypothetical protein
MENTFKKSHGKTQSQEPTQVNGHSLKLQFYMFERSQRKQNSLDYHKFF